MWVSVDMWTDARRHVQADKQYVADADVTFDRRRRHVQ